jgi:hypothetical protein
MHTAPVTLPKPVFMGSGSRANALGQDDAAQYRYWSGLYGPSTGTPM